MKPSQTQPPPRGQGLVEYALILALAALVAVLVLGVLGVSVRDVYAALLEGLGGADRCSSIYQGNFKSPLSGWNTITSKFWKGNVYTQNGQLVADPMGTAILSGYNGADYTINVGNVTLEQTNPAYNGFGVNFRSSTDGKGNLSGYMFEFEKKNKNDPGVMVFTKWVNGVQITPPISSAPVPAGFDWSKPGNLDLQVSGNTFTAYLNGKPVLTGSDTTYKTGSAGLAANNGSRVRVGGFGVGTSGCSPTQP